MNVLEKEIRMAHAGQRTHGLLAKSCTRVFTGNGMHDSLGL